jgi:hypothetical protein
MATAIMKERLRLSAARCIVHRTPDWWSTTMTEPEEFEEANLWASRRGDLASPEEAANFLLLVAEAIDE